MKIVIFFIHLCLIFNLASCNKKPVVSNEKKAIKIAVKTWLTIYGPNIYDEKPYYGRLEKDSIWIVEGSLPEGGIKTNERGDTTEITVVVGGTAYIEIRKSDGKVLKVTHGK